MEDIPESQLSKNEEGNRNVCLIAWYSLCVCMSWDVPSKHPQHTSAVSPALFYEMLCSEN